ncbi:MAG: hypothetical protein F6K03_16530, partial [Kamptonema sp. SIO4C4]|nr:hypothetical protein [Kamptonema sp. SIO4C4]
GAGIIWQPVENFVVRLEYGYPLVDLDTRGNNAQDDGLYFTLNYRF